MPYAKLDENNRIQDWCYEKFIGLDVEFFNGEYIDENAKDGVEDFIIIDGMAIYAPSYEKKIAQLKQNLLDTDYNILKIMEGAATLSEKADIIAQRAEWRREINELEEKIKNGEKFEIPQNL